MSEQGRDITAGTDLEQVSTAIAAVTSSMVHGVDLPTVLQTVADQACGCFEAYSAVVVLLDPRQIAGTAALHIVAESSPHTVDSSPLINTVGPALDSARTGAVALVADLSSNDDTRWPQYRRRALDAGLRGVRAFPVIGVAAGIGSIVIHTKQPWRPDHPNQAGQVFADLTALALSAGSKSNRDAALDDTIDSVLEGTTIIATATGMLAQARGLDLDTARLTLIRLARAHGVTSTAHAREILAAQRRYPTDPGKAGVFDPPDLPRPPRIDE
ncbi:GAF domain-containing protein [Williamsia limnetica]|uniref:GAF domain-containing protein n=1 Tax=Williamsia limnetica TaxID=882452 RepID=A0A318RN74_WILLI|nr:GAF domain-containing protein [Williamsia limnetica]PYE17389.1 GAF domain-containing protein [Williamsia limnetica]